MKIKGEYQIELRDAKTGKIADQRIGHNFVTDFWQELMKPMGYLVSNPWTGRENVPVNDLFGGIMCFDSAINETADMTGRHSHPIFPPSRLNMTANGSISYASSSSSATELGAYNASESLGSDGRSRRFVYDWDTNEGNGVIGCVCLTSRYGGYKGVGNTTSNGRDTSVNAFEPMQASGNTSRTSQMLSDNVVAYVNKSRNVVAFITSFQPTQGTLTITEYDMGTMLVNPFASLNDLTTNAKRVVNTRTYTFTPITDNVGTLEARSAYGYWFIVTNSGPNDSTNVINIVRFNIDNTQEQYRIPNCPVGYTYTYADWGAGLFNYAFLGNHFITACLNNGYPQYNYVNDINLQTLNVTRLGILPAGDITGQGVILEDRFYLGPYCIRLNNGVAQLMNMNGATTVGFSNGASNGHNAGGQFIDDPYTVFSGKGRRSQSEADRGLCVTGTIPREYLATIANLSQPVIKTADKTMKITYTLTLVEE